ncbi:hypothetical protein [Streptomyces sp. NPDC016845]|uniref:hypothetical protein n=1 Tax=Streptomyces sp. NPDC016845 TaxID=3364972 RepID=UPI00378DFE83
MAPGSVTGSGLQLPGPPALHRVMRPAPGEVPHFSEDPAITEFRPHVAATARVVVGTAGADRRAAFGASSEQRVHVMPAADDLWTFWDAVTTSTLGFSGIRLHNATPR